MKKIVLIRHGESVWNKENKFTGWVDVDLSEKGKEEARQAGKVLKENGFSFDLAFSSYLKRAIKTLNTVLEELDELHIPVVKSWKLNERHYGSLQGLNKSEMAQKFGEDQVLVWRRSYDTPPPELDSKDPASPVNDPKYKGINPDELPLTECLKDTVARFLPYYESTIVPEIKAGKNIIIAAHGNSLRSLVKHLDQISDDDIVSVNIPTAMPLVYELDDQLKPLKHYYLGDAEAVAKAMESVANQGKSKA